MLRIVCYGNLGLRLNCLFCRAERLIVDKYCNTSVKNAAWLTPCLNQSKAYSVICTSSKVAEIKTVFKGLQTLYETYLPKAHPILVHDLLLREQLKT
jgi:hypothetical protein